MQIDRHTIRMTAAMLLIAVAAFVMVHDMGTGAILDNPTAGTSHLQEGASDAHEALALCAIALVLGFSLLGVRASADSTAQPIRLGFTSPRSPAPRYVARSRLYELCVIRA